MSTDIDQDTPPEPMPRKEPEFGLGHPERTPMATPGNLTGEVAAAEREIDPNEALTEAQESEKIKATPVDGEEPVDVLNVLQPKAEPHTWRIGPEGMEMEFVQRPLGFLAKMQWFALVGDVLDKAMAGDDGVSINELLSSPTQRGMTPSLADFRDADTFVRAIGKLLVHAPKFLTDSYCIWLGVPDQQRKLVGDIMALPPGEGGLSDDDGLEIIEVFIDQNYDALADFFGGKISALQRRVSARQQERSKKSAARA